MTSPPAGEPAGGVGDDAGSPTSRQLRQAQRAARRQAKDAAFELRQERRRAKDGTSWRGHHIVDSRGLTEAFPEPETPEFSTASIRRRILHGVILVLLLAVVVAAVVLAAMIQRGELTLPAGNDDPDIAPASCPASTLAYAPNNTVTVNVYNGGAREGQAGQVAEELRSRGFVVQEVANASAALTAPAVVVSGTEGHAAALTLQRQFAGSDFIQDERSDASVDVILTSAFTAVLAVPEVSVAPGVLACPHLSPPASGPAPDQQPASPAAAGQRISMLP